MEIITSHLHADFDSLASMVAAQKIYPEAVMVFSGSQEKNVRDFLSQSTFVYRFQRLKNIALSTVSRLIIVDTRQKSRIGKFAECLENPGIEVHIFDHHPDAPGDLTGNYEIVEALGSTTTLFTRLFQERKIAVTKEDATLMAMAIHEDTGSFSFDTTTAEDMEAAAWLLRQGADLSAVNRFIAQELTASELGILNEMINTATNYTIQGVDIVVAKALMPNYIDEFALLVRKFMVIENLNALFALANMGDRVYLIARSRIPEVNAGKIALEFGGGGHASAASSTIKNMTMIEAEEKLIRLLHKHVLPKSLAMDLMSSPVISITPEVTINKAHDVLTRYSITVLPVLEENKRISGLISRRVVEKAIFHGLGNLPASDYMSTDFAVLSPEATLADIQELIIEHRQRFIPVVADEVVCGVITRTDLLSILIKDPAHTPSSYSRDAQPSTERNRNLNSLMINFLGRDMIVLLQTIGEVAERHKYAAFAVGGFVRDLLRQTSNMDLDIVVEGDGIDFARHLARQLGGTVREHEKFNTAVVKLPDGFKIDVATARLEYYEYPAAMPTVELSSIKLDLFRRDFTINALAIHLNPDKFGILVDFFNCQNDIRDQQIRVLHNLSFVEDPTRIFRAIRFEQRLGFTLGKLTEKLIKNAIKMEMYGRFSGNRFFHELKFILSEENPLPAIYRMARFNLLEFLHPAMKLDSRLKDILRETHRSLAWYRLLYLDEPCCQWLVFLLALTSKLNGKQMQTFCTKFEILEKTRKTLLRERLTVSKVLKVLNKRPLDPEPPQDGARSQPVYTLSEPLDLTIQGPPLRPSEVYWMLKGLSSEGLLYLMGITVSKSGKKAVSYYVTHLRQVKPILAGHDLKKMGYAAGPQFTTILNHLLEAKLDGIVMNRKDEEEFLKQKYPLESQSVPGGS